MAFVGWLLIVMVLQDIADLDNDLDAQEEADREDIDNVGFALYEKVQRSKNRWKCSLRYGVFFINGKEYMFNKASTDLTF
jgi:transcription initiation factor TFIIA large subunit